MRCGDKVRLAGIFVILFLLQGFVCRSQGNHSFIRFTKEEGLSSSEVQTVFEDKKGFLWIGTANGLDMYDGVRFHHFASSETHIPTTIIVQVFKVNEKVWVQSQYEAGYLDANTLKYQTVPILINGQAQRFEGTIYLDSHNNILLTTYSYGLLRYNRQTRAFTKDSLPIRYPANWQLNTLFEDRLHNNYWIGARQGLAMYEGKTGKLFYKDHNPDGLRIFTDTNANKGVDYILIDAKGYLWTENWNNNSNYIHRFDPRTNTLERMNAYGQYVHGYSQYNGFFQQKNGHYWFYGENKLEDWNGTGDRFHADLAGTGFAAGILYSKVFQMIEDKEENLWIATDKGLYVLPSRTQHVASIWFNLEEEMDINSFNQINGNLLIATWGKGVLAIDSMMMPLRAPYTTRDIPDINYSMVWSTCKHSRTGDVWLACQSGRLVVFEKSAGMRQLLRPPAFEGRTIRKAVEDDQGNLWFASQGGHLVKWIYNKGPVKEEDFQLIRKFHGIITELYFDKKGLWVGTVQEGAFLVDPRTGIILQHYDVNSAQPLINNDVIYIRPMNDSIYYLVSSGINILNLRSGYIRRITPNNGLPFNRIRQACIDNNGLLWVCGSDNMYRYNYRTNHFASFGPDEGFSSVFDISQASFKMGDGRLVFGGNNQIVLFDPARTNVRMRPPDVAISFFKVFDHYLSVDSLSALKEVVFDHSQNTLGIYFAAPSFLQRHKITYYYKLEGLERNWNRADGAYASYNSLSPGHYIFQVRAENDEGLQSAHVTILHLYVRPPVWGTWWFIALVAIAIALLIYYVYRLRINQLLAVQRIRSKVARDLHDDVGATLTTIGILSEMAKVKTNGNEEARELIDKISDNSGRMMEAMDDIVWSINPNNDSMQKITARMREYAVTLLEAKGIDYNFYVDEHIQNLVLKMESRRDLFLIFKETVNNLVKYSRSTFVDISISKQHGMLAMCIADNGVGFDLNNYKKGNGIINLRKRARQMGGQINIISNQHQGTTVYLELPIT